MLQTFNTVKKYFLTGAPANLKAASEKDRENFKLLSEWLGSVDENSLDWDLQKNFVATLEPPKPEDVLEKYQLFYYQLSVAVIFLRLNLVGVFLYTREECEAIIKREKTEFAPGIFLLSLREYLDDKDGHELGWLLSDPKSNWLEFENEVSWFTVVSRTVLLHLAFHWFYTLPDDSQEFLLSYFWWAALAGVPLLKDLGEAAYQTRTIAEYVIVNRQLLQALEANQEILPTENSENPPLFIIKARECYDALIKSQVRDSKTIEQAVETFVKKTYTEIYQEERMVEGLIRAFTVYSCLREAKLVDHNIAGDENEGQIFDQELLRLIEKFSNQKAWSQLSAYFKNPESRVSWKQFFMQYAQNIDPQTELDAVSKLLEFNAFLQQEKIVPDNFVPVVFEENDGQFHWDSELLS